VAGAPPAPELRDDLIRLRRFTDVDVPAIARACNDPEMRFASAIPSPYTEDDAREYVRLARESRGRWILCISDENEAVLGSIDLRAAGDGTGSVGYWVAPEARRRGIATQALRLVSRWALDELGVERLTLTTDPANAASQRVAEKAGFQRVGTVERPVHGRERSVLFELRRGLDET
jgi:RimJ/RimL family protein N-acetyltransferase